MIGMEEAIHEEEMSRGHAVKALCGEAPPTISAQARVSVPQHQSKRGIDRAITLVGVFQS
jgi:hypothetical protein